MREPADKLRERFNRLHLRQRVGIEGEGEAPLFGQGLTWFHIENWLSFARALQFFLRLSGLSRRAARNCHDIQIRTNEVVMARLPRAFDGFTILQLSDLHIDLSPQFAHVLCERVRGLKYDLCVLTGDYRYMTSGTCEAALAGMERLRLFLGERALAILGNHDSADMVPALEAMGYELLLNETTCVERAGDRLYFAGVDDPHFFRTDNLEKACLDIPDGAARILLSHSPELFRQACYADVDLMLCGHTHGGQICLPGGVPLVVNAACPRRFSRGPWRYETMQGYTSTGTGSSIAVVRFNCPPEVTLHRLRCPA